MRDLYNFDDLISIMKTLLGENGCPWDKAQTHETLRQYIIEECYEVVEEINSGNQENLCEELGDVLLQIVFHAQISKAFTIENVTDGICRKMINRHPHIFSGEALKTPKEVKDNWERIKKTEKSYEKTGEILKNIPKSLPALLRAKKVQNKSEIDYEGLDSILQGAYKEISELKEFSDKSEKEKMEKYGDVLFSIVNISRFLKINPEFALTNSIEKFINRFEYVENVSVLQGRQIKDLSSDEMDSLWGESKNILE